MPFKVLIIGAGIGGLALAQILRKQGILFEVFERDDGTRKQGWALGLDECLPELKQMLPTEIDPLQNASTNYAAQKPDSYAFVHGGTHEVLGIIAPQDGGREFISADRNALRRILMQHVDLQYGKQLKSYVQDEAGVAAHLVDGSSAQGAVVVGADGANSAVRSQLLPGFKATASRYAILSANVTLTPKEYQPMLDRANTCVIFGQPDMKSYIMLMAYHEDRTAAWHWVVAKRSSDAGSVHAWTQAASAEELWQEAMRWTENHPDYYKAAVKRTGANSMHTPPVKLIETVLPVDVLPDGALTLLGDAAHSMVPFRGGGANTTLLDACDLGSVLAALSQPSGDDIRQALREYERAMIPRGRSTVLGSGADGEGENFDTSGGRLEQQAKADGVAG